MSRTFRNGKWLPMLAAVVASVLLAACAPQSTSNTKATDIAAATSSAQPSHNPIATWMPSPNFDQRKPFMIVLHFTQEGSAKQALHTLTTANSGGPVSAQYMIGDDGHIYQLVHDIDRAWQAGSGRWGTVTDVNSASIGIELDNNGNEPFSKAQIDSLLRLLADLTERWDIPPTHIIGHEDMAPKRRSDPGQYFPWETLAKHGFGLWPEGKLLDPPADFNPWLALSAIGYPVNNHNHGAIVHAFHNHFRGMGSNSIPGNLIEGQKVHPFSANKLDAKDLKILYTLVSQLGYN
ncbi:MAG TPA: N-acetylmuramoyl-L-alanine amidase [Oleiagrimonas sp.]|nr:N-acetylmuramoyl-L-alanine amidase [Oleiagrimonas sp.]